MKKRIMALVLMTVVAFTSFSGCTKSTVPDNQLEEDNQEQDQTGDEEEELTERKREETTIMRIGFLKGPTAIGAALFMNETENGIVFGNYEFELFNAPDEITAKIRNGELDVVAVPVNIASALYNETGGDVLIAALNTLGTLYLVEQGSAVKTVSDLSGKKVVMAGEGSIPEYVFQYILDKAGVTDCEVELVPTHTDAVVAVSSGSASLALLPEPFVSVAVTKNTGMRVALDLAKEWDAYSYEEEGVPNTLTMGCIVVRKEYLEANQKAFNKFLDEYEYFVETSTEDPAVTAQYVVGYEILDDVTIAEKAIPNCNIMYIEGSKMLRLVNNFCQIMYEANPQAIGGNIPGEGFYYVRKY